MNVVSLLWDRVKKHPDKTAIISKSEKITYSELWRNIQVILNFLRSTDFKKGDKVALFLPDSVEFVACFYAILMGGGSVVPLASCLRQFEISAMLRNCMPSLIITHFDLWEKATLGQPFEAKVISTTQITSEVNGVWDEDIEPCEPDSVASINYTYTGTGYPQGAELTHGNYLYGFNGLIRHLGLRNDDVFLAPLPMAQIYALALGNLVPILSGATMVITNSYFPTTLLELVENYNVTILLSVPSLLELFSRTFLQRKSLKQSLRFMISGGDYMPPELSALIAERCKVPVVQGYGLTECMPIVCNVPNGPDKPGSLGIPGEGIFVRIVDSVMNALETGGIGEILVNSPTTMKRYHRMPEDTQNAFFDGWLRTGDLGSVDDDGFLYFAGLKKRIFNFSGMKVDPIELECVSRLHPSIKDIKFYDQTIEGIVPRKVLIAEVVLNDQAQLEEDELKEFYKARIAWYKIPKHIIIKQ
jgi:long-chain acyl-CoA synthetase